MINTGDEKRTKKTVSKLLKKGLSSMNCVEINKDADQLVCGDDKGTLTV